jgi:hypothetical protein
MKLAVESNCQPSAGPALDKTGPVSSHAVIRHKENK